MTGPLKNARHERFAQELSKGQSQTDAYVSAGYKSDRGAAARLSAKVSIQERSSELKARAAEKAVVTVEGLTDRLLKIAKKGEDANDAPLLSVARASLMDAAKLNGLLPDRHELTGRNGGPIEYRTLSDEEIDARIKAHEEARARQLADK